MLIRPTHLFGANGEIIFVGFYKYSILEKTDKCFFCSISTKNIHSVGSGNMK